MSSVKKAVRLSTPSESFALHNHQLNLLNDAVCITTLDGQIVFTNNCFNELFGFEPEELINQNISQLDTFSDLESKRYRNEIQAALNGNNIWSGTLECVKKNEIKFEALCRFSKFENQDELYCFGIIEDISANKDKVEQDQLLKDTQRDAQIGGWTLDVETMNSSWTEEIYRIYELPVGKQISREEEIKFYHPEDRKRMQECIQNAIEKKESFDGDFRFVTLNNNKKWLRATGRPVFKNGKLTQLRGTLQDITIQKELEFEKAVVDLRYKSAINNSPGMFFQFVLNQNNKLSFSFVSDRAYEIYEIPRSYFYGNSGVFFDLIHPEDAQVLIKLIKNAKKQEVKIDWCGRIHLKEEKFKWIKLHATSSISPDEKLIWNGVAVDVTAEKESEIELEGYREHLELLAASSELGLWDWNLVTNVVHYDERWCEMLGYQVSELKMDLSTWQTLVHPDDLEFSTHLFQDYLCGRSDRYEVKYKMRHKNGSWIPILSTGKILRRNEEGIPTRFTGTHYDLSYQTALEESVRENELKAITASKLALVGEISAGVAHEINNPLAIIQGMAQTLIKSIESGDLVKSNDKIQKIIKATERASAIVKNLKKISKDDTNDPFEPIDPNELVLNIIEFSSEFIKKEGVELEIDLRAKKHFLGHPNELSQVFINLISNAIHASENLPEKWIKIETYNLGKKIIFKFTDSGLGIAEETRLKMFNPFYTTKETGKGTGLGLSISKSIIDRHQGEFYYDENSENTCFVITFKEEALWQE